MVLKRWVKKRKAGRWRRAEMQMWHHADVGPTGTKERETCVPGRQPQHIAENQDVRPDVALVRKAAVTPWTLLLAVSAQATFEWL